MTPSKPKNDWAMQAADEIAERLGTNPCSGKPLALDVKIVADIIRKHSLRGSGQAGGE